MGTSTGSPIDAVSPLGYTGVMRNLYVGGKFGFKQSNWALVDDEDWMRCATKTWSCSDGKRISSGLRSGKSGVTFSLPDFILKFPNCETIDHIDRNIWNNQKSNLRESTRQLQEANKGLTSQNTSGYKGVSWSTEKSMWVVRVKINGKTKFFGYFRNKEEAALKYNRIALKFFGESAYLNKIEEPDGTN